MIQIAESGKKMQVYVDRDRVRIAARMASSKKVTLAPVKS
jgi:hypothetical protein